MRRDHRVTIHTWNEPWAATVSTHQRKQRKSFFSACSCNNKLFLYSCRNVWTHFSTLWVSWRSWSPHLIGEIIKVLCRHVAGAGLLKGGRRKVWAILVAVFQLGGSVAIFWSIRSDCHGFGLYPRHDWLSVEHPDILSQVLVGLMTHTDSRQHEIVSNCTNSADCWQTLTKFWCSSHVFFINVINVPTKSESIIRRCCTDCGVSWG